MNGTLPGPGVGEVVEGRVVKPEFFKGLYIYPGLVQYESEGIVLVRQEVLDRMAPSIVGVPFLLDHEDFDISEFLKKSVGDVIEQWKDASGYFCRYQVWNDVAIRKIKSGQHSLSCAFKAKQFGPGGVYNDIRYQKELLDGEYTHLALVDEPRFTDAKIMLNKTGGVKPMFKIFKHETEPEKRKFHVVDAGEKVTADELAKMWAEHKKDREEYGEALGENDHLEIDGEKVPVKDLLELRHRLKAESGREEGGSGTKKEEKPEEEPSKKEEKEVRDDEEKEDAKDEKGVRHNESGIVKGPKRQETETFYAKRGEGAAVAAPVMTLGKSFEIGKALYDLKARK